MFIKARLKKLNQYRIVGMRRMAALPWPVIGSMAAGVLAVSMLALFQAGTPPVPDPVIESEVEVPHLPLLPPPAWQVAMDALPGAVPLPSEPAKRHPKAPNAYDQAMKIAYRAYREQDYQTALINFRRALKHKEGDRYATEAIGNVEAIIQRQRQSDTN